MELCDNIDIKNISYIIKLDKKVSKVNVKSKILKIRNLPIDGKKVDQIKAKPYMFIIVILLFGIALLWTNFYLLGILITLFFLYYLLFVKDTLLVEFYDYYVVFYLNNGKEECFLLFWEDIDHWDISCSRRECDVLNITLKNNETLALKCLARKKVEKYFTIYASQDHEQTISKQQVL